MMDTVRERFANVLANDSVSLDRNQLDQFESYYRLLVEWNEKMNLTAITDRTSVYFKHFYDSLLLSTAVPMGEIESVADVGTGAGFPGIPLKIAYPHLKLTLIDSLNKRLTFLRHVISATGLEDVQCLHGRAEELGRAPELRDKFDLVTARAVARLNVLNELCLPFARPGGCFVAMKGAQGREEVAEAGRSLALLRGEVERVVPSVLPDDLGDRWIIVIRKTAMTPKAYPRKPGTPAKTPL